MQRRENFSETIFQQCCLCFRFKLSLLFLFHYHNDKESFIADWGSTCKKLSRSLTSSMDHAPFSRHSLENGIALVNACENSQDRMEKRQARSIFRHRTNKIDLIIRADAILFQSFSTFLVYFLRFISLCVCVIVPKKHTARFSRPLVCVCVYIWAALVGGREIKAMFFAFVFGVPVCRLSIVYPFFPPRGLKIWIFPSSNVDSEELVRCYYTLQWYVH